MHFCYLLDEIPSVSQTIHCVYKKQNCAHNTIMLSFNLNLELLSIMSMGHYWYQAYIAASVLLHNTRDFIASPSPSPNVAFIPSY